MVYLLIDTEYVNSMFYKKTSGQRMSVFQKIL